MTTYLYGALNVCFYHVTYAFRVNLHSGFPECQGTDLLETHAIPQN